MTVVGSNISIAAYTTVLPIYVVCMASSISQYGEIRSVVEGRLDKARAFRRETEIAPNRGRRRKFLLNHSLAKRWRYFLSDGAIFAGTTIVTQSSVAVSKTTEDPSLAVMASDTSSIRRANSPRMNLSFTGPFQVRL